MDPMDVLLLAVVLASVGSFVVGTVLSRRFGRRYLPEGAIAQATVLPDEAFALEVPASAGGELMLRYLVQRPPRGSSGSRYGIRGAVALGDGSPEDAFSIGWDGLGKRGGRHIGATYAVRRMGRDTEATAVIARVPAGGPLRVHGRISGTPGTEVLSMTVFVR